MKLDSLWGKVLNPCIYNTSLRPNTTNREAITEKQKVIANKINTVELIVISADNVLLTQNNQSFTPLSQWD